MSQRIVESAYLRYKILCQVCRQFYVVLHVLNCAKKKFCFVLFRNFSAATRAVCSNFLEHCSLLVHLMTMWLLAI